MKVFSNSFLDHQGIFRINQSLIQCTKACREKMFENTKKTNYINLMQCIHFNIKQRLHSHKYTFSLQTCFSLEFFPCKITNIFIWIVCALFHSGTDMTFSVWGGLKFEALARQNTEKLLLNPKQFINQPESIAASDGLDRRQRSSSRRQDEEDEEGEEELTSHSLDDHHLITHPANGIGLILTISSSHFLPFCVILPQR